MIHNFGLRVTSGDEWTQNDNLKLFPSTFDARKNMYTWTLEPKSEEGGSDNEQIGGKTRSRRPLGWRGGGGLKK